MVKKNKRVGQQKKEIIMVKIKSLVRTAEHRRKGSSKNKNQSYPTPGGHKKHGRIRVAVEMSSS